MTGKKKKNKFLIVTTALALAACIAAVSIVFAWMTNSASVSKMGFSLGQLSCSVTLYKGIDSNYNGVPDLLGVGNTGVKAGGTKSDTKTSAHGQYREATSTTATGTTATTATWTDYDALYYGEKYAFEFVETKSMLSNTETQGNIFSQVTISDVEPSRIYTFKFSVNNESQYNGNLKFSFEAFNYYPSTETESSTSSAEILSDFECRLYTVDNSSSDATDPAKITLATTDWMTFNSDGVTLAKEVSISKYDSTATTYKHIKDVWLQIKMNDTATYVADENGNPVYNSGNDVIFPYFKISFTSIEESSSST